MKKINFVIPVLDEEKNIIKFVDSIKSLKLNYKIEIIFIDDGSKDKTLEKIKSVAIHDKEIKFISFSKNFGHQIALSAGLDHSNGDLIIMLDGDFQHPIDKIPAMINKYENGYDVVQMVKKTQGKRNIFIKGYTFIFYFLFRKFSNIKLSNNVSDFRLISSKVNNQLKKLKEKERFLRGLVQWIGFKYTEINYMPSERKYGVSKYNFFKLLKLASFGIFAFTTIPLKLSLYFGIFLSFLSFIYGIYAVIKKLISPSVVPVGYTDLIVFITFIGGIQLIFLGLIGLYISKIFDQVRDRPLYIIDEKNIND